MIPFKQNKNEMHTPDDGDIHLKSDNSSGNTTPTGKNQEKPGSVSIEDLERAVFENSGISMAFINEDTTINLVNKEFEKLTGFKKTLVEKKMRWTEIIAFEDDLDRMKAYHRLRRSDPAHAPKSYETRIKKNEGEVINLLVHVTLIPGTTYSLASMIDITERKLAEEKFTKVFIMSPDCIAITRMSDGMIADVNIGFEDITGWKREEAIGQTSLEINFWANPDDRAVMVGDLQAGKEIMHREFQFRRKDSSCRDGIYSARSINIAGEKYLIYVLQDVTFQKQAQDSLRKSLEEKEVLLKELYHRTKNNMQVISSLLKLKSVRIDDPDVHDIFNEIQTKIQTMALVHQKLYESNDLTNINLNDFVKSLSDLLLMNYALTPDRLSIKQSVDNIPLSIDFAMPLGIILNELISNTIKHAFPKNHRGGITIEIHAVGEKLTLDFSDNGIGLPGGFDPDKTETLGMHIIQNIAKNQLGGDIRFVAKKGFGCVISFKTNLYQKRV